jgi:hypothetical protein
MKDYDDTTEFDKNQISNIIKKDFSILKDMNIVSIDLCKDKKGKWWLIENNTTPGMNGFFSILIYISIFEDFYKTSIIDSEWNKYLNILYQLYNATNKVMEFKIDNKFFDKKYLHGYKI